MVATFEALASKRGRPLSDSLGRRAYGGHSAQVTGAQLLSCLAAEISKLSLLGRWKSDVVLRYVGEAPLARLTAGVGSFCKVLVCGLVV